MDHRADGFSSPLVGLKPFLSALINLTRLDASALCSATAGHQQANVAPGQYLYRQALVSSQTVAPAPKNLVGHHNIAKEVGVEHLVNSEPQTCSAVGISSVLVVQRHFVCTRHNLKLHPNGSCWGWLGWYIAFNCTELRHQPVKNRSKLLDPPTNHWRHKPFELLTTNGLNEILQRNQLLASNWFL